MTIFEIVNKRPIGSILTSMERLQGTKAIKPKRLLRDDITIGASFKRGRELWFTMSKCFSVDPDKRPQVWEVREEINDLLKFPSCFGDRDYVKEDSYGSKTESSDNEHDDDLHGVLMTPFNTLHGLSDSSDKELL